MIFKSFDKSNNGIDIINSYIEEGKKVFILIFMEGCGPCNATRPEWNKIKEILENKYKTNNNIVIVDVNNIYLKDLKYIGNVDGFPTLKYISDKGNKVESYEDALISNKDRTVNSFIEWIESKLDMNIKGGKKKSSVYHLYNRISKKTKNTRNTRKKKSYKRKSYKRKRINKK